MSWVTRNLKEDITHWSFNSGDEFGTILVNTPTLIKGRWEDEAVLLDENASDTISARDKVYLERAVRTGDYLARGDFTSIEDPSDVNEAQRVERTKRCTTLRNLQTEHVAYV